MDNSNIIRGRIFNAAIISTNGRPLEFLEEQEGDTYKIIPKNDGLEGKVDLKTGKRKAEVLKIATEVKLRPVVVIQSDKNSNYPLVVVLPLANIPKAKKRNENN